MFCWWFVNVIITDRMNNDENEKAVKPPTNKSCRVLLEMIHRFTRFTPSQILRFPCHFHHLSCNLRPLHSSDGHLAKWECREIPQQWPLNRENDDTLINSGILDDFGVFYIQTTPCARSFCVYFLTWTLSLKKWLLFGPHHTHLDITPRMSTLRSSNRLEKIFCR